MKARWVAWAVLAAAVVVVLAAVALAALDRAGFSRVLCGVTAAAAPADEARGVEADEALLAAHPALRRALDEAADGGHGYAPVDDCAEGDALAQALRDRGAPEDASGGLLVRHEGRAFAVGVSRGVA